MPRTPKGSPPSYRLHKPTGHAVVTLNGRDFYPGRHGSPASWAEYDRLIAQWLANGTKSDAEILRSYELRRERTVTEGIERAAPGQKPGGVAIREVKAIASIEKIDTKKNVVTLRGPQHTVDVKVQDPAMLKGVKVGDMVEASYTEAIAIKVVAGK